MLGNIKAVSTQLFRFQLPDRIFDSCLYKMADESLQKPESENSEEQGEARNDVVVKIGLVGDAQVISRNYTFSINLMLTYAANLLIKPGWKNDIDG